jgi:hypothetical protein
LHTFIFYTNVHVITLQLLNDNKLGPNLCT